MKIFYHNRSRIFALSVIIALSSLASPTLSRACGWGNPKLEVGDVVFASVAVLSGKWCKAVVVTPGREQSQVEFTRYCESPHVFTPDISQGERMWISTCSLVPPEPRYWYHGDVPK